MKETYHREAVATEPIQQSTIETPFVASNRIAIGLALLALYVIWGSTYLGMRIALESIPAFIMSGIRFIIAGGLLYVFLRARHTPVPTRKQWAGAALIGFLLVACGNGGVSLAEQWNVASGLAAVAVGAMPLWAALFMGLMGRWPTRLEWIGLALGFVGVVLLNLENGLWSSPLGAICLILAPVCWALGSALSSRISLPPGLMASAAQMMIGGVIMLALGLLFGERIKSLPSVSSLLALAYLIIFGSLVAFTAYGYLLRRVRPALATSYAYVNPLVAVGLGVSMAGEHITLVGLLAMFVILTGVGLVSLGRHK
ncbi:MAG TPA: drug/metabolite exporter YedA [Ktedonosporobacter sp.]|nr:drug/metabolite exporter YedA [Ktedonosporobacter sp.]